MRQFQMWSQNSNRITFQPLKKNCEKLGEYTILPAFDRLPQAVAACDACLTTAVLEPGEFNAACPCCWFLRILDFLFLGSW